MAPSYSGLTVATNTTIAKTWGDMVRDSVINIFASAAARDSAITAPTEGMYCHLTDAPKRLTYHNGSKWMLVAARVRATQTTWASSTTLSAVTGMTIPLDASGVYEWELFTSVFGFQNIGVSLALQIPTSATLDAQIQGWQDSSGAQFTANVVAATGNAALSPASVGWGYNGSTNQSSTIGKGSITTGATAGNAVLLGAQRVSNASLSRVDAPTWMEVRQVV